MAWTPFPHRDYLRESFLPVLARLRVLQAGEIELLEGLRCRLESSPTELRYVEDAIVNSRRQRVRLSTVQTHPVFRLLSDVPDACITSKVGVDEWGIVRLALTLAASKTEEVGYWRYLNLICELADLADIKPLLEATLSDAEKFDDWLRRAFETLAVRQLQCVGVLSTSNPGNDAQEKSGGSSA
jgi:hypothetical protein